MSGKKPPAALSRKEREHRRHREEILRAAEKVFARDGYYAATVEKIAREAEFSVGTLYNFFKSKEELYVRVFESIGRDFMSLLEERVLAETDVRRAVEALIRLRLELVDRHRGFFLVFVETSPGSRLDPDVGLPPSCVVLYDRYLEAVQGVFARDCARARGEEEGDPLCLTLCLEGVLNAFASYWMRRGLAEPIETRAEKITGAFLRYAGMEGKNGEA